MLLLLGRALTLLINLVVQVITIRYLAKSDFGAFAFGVTMLALATNLTTFGLPKSLSRFMPIYQERGEPEKVAGLLILVCGLVVTMSVVSIAIVYGLSLTSAVQATVDTTSLSLLLILILLTPIDAIDRVLEAVFSVAGQVRAIFIRRHLIGPALKLLAVLLVVSFGGSVKTLAVFYVFAGIAGLAFYVTILRMVWPGKAMFPDPKLRRFQLPSREIFAYSVPLFSSQIGFVARSSVVVLLLQAYADNVAVADFRSVLPFARLNEVVLGSFALMFMPMASRLYAKNELDVINELYWRSSVWIMLFSLPVFLITGVLAESFTPLAIGERYSSSSSVLLMLAIGFFFDAFMGLNAHALRVFAKVWHIVAVDVLAIFLCLGLCIALIPTQGAWGAAIAICSTTIIQNLLLQLVLCWTTGVGAIRWHYARFYVSASVAIAIVALVQWLWNPPFLLGAFVATGVYIGLAVTHRSLLQVEETFPELLKLPFVARLFATSEKRKLASANKGR